MNRLPTSYFESLYAAAPDPWGFESRWYESRKYALTIAALPRERYTRAFEPGCSLGVLTERLAPRCEVLIASEPVADVARRARARLKRYPHVAVTDDAIPDRWPEGSFDLVLVSELGYYLSDAGLNQLLQQIDASLAADGHVVAVHWRGSTRAPLTGAEVHARFDAHPTWGRRAHYEERDFLIDVYERRGE